MVLHPPERAWTGMETSFLRAAGGFQETGFQPFLPAAKGGDGNRRKADRDRKAAAGRP